MSPDRPEPRPTRHLTLEGNKWRFVDDPPPTQQIPPKVPAEKKDDDNGRPAKDHDSED